MDKVALYRQYIQQLIQAKADRSMKSAKNVEAQPIFDRERVGLCPAAGIAISWCMWVGSRMISGIMDVCYIWILKMARFGFNMMVRKMVSPMSY